MKVRDCMCNDVACVGPDATIKEVAKLMQNRHVGCIPVCDSNQKVLGIVTDRDLILRTLACDKDVNQTKVSDVMTTKIYNCTPEAEIEDVEQIMCDCQIRRVPVVENEQLIGIITIGDLAHNKNVNSDEMSYTFERICKCGDNAKNAE